MRPSTDRRPLRQPSAAAKGVWRGYFAAPEAENSHPFAEAPARADLPGAWRLVGRKLAFFPRWGSYAEDPDFESKHPRNPRGPKGGEFAPKGGDAGAPVRELPRVKVRETDARAWSGRQDEAAGMWSKDRTGKVAEGLTIEWLKRRGFGDARTLNVATNNFPLDLVHDHEVIEVKAGLVSNGRSAQQWRSTAGEPGKAEKAWLAKATSSQKASWNARKQAEILARKQAAAVAVSKSLGFPLKTATVGIIIHPASGVADIYKFDGFHLRIGWNSALAKSGYVGSLRFKASAFARYSLHGEAEEAAAGSAPLSAGDGPVPPAVWAELQASLAEDARKWVRALLEETQTESKEYVSGGISDNPDFEAKHPRGEHGRWTAKGAPASSGETPSFGVPWSFDPAQQKVPGVLRLTVAGKPFDFGTPSKVPVPNERYVTGLYSPVEDRIGYFGLGPAGEATRLGTIHHEDLLEALHGARGGKDRDIEAYSDSLAHITIQDRGLPKERITIIPAYYKDNPFAERRGVAATIRALQLSGVSTEGRVTVHWILAGHLAAKPFSRSYQAEQDSTDYVAIEKGLDALEAELLPRLKRVFAGAQEKMLSLVERVTRGSGLTPRFVDGLEVRGLGDLVPLLRAYLRAAYGFGRREVGREIGKAPRILERAVGQVLVDYPGLSRSRVLAAVNRRLKAYQIGPPQDAKKKKPSIFDPPGIEVAVSAPGEALAPSFFVEPIDALRWFEDKAFVWRGILADDLLTDIKSALMGAIRTGQLLGDTMAALRRIFAPYAGDLAALPDQEQMQPYRLETLVRTNTTEAFNQGRLAGAADQVASGFVAGWKWSAILDARTTQVCRFLDGKILPPDGPVLQRLLPPRCWNCRSTLIPVTRVTTPEPEIITPEEVARAVELSCAGFSEEERARAYAGDPDFESKHPRKGKGPGGGEFAPKGGGGSEQSSNRVGALSRRGGMLPNSSIEYVYGSALDPSVAVSESWGNKGRYLGIVYDPKTEQFGIVNGVDIHLALLKVMGAESPAKMDAFAHVNIAARGTDRQWGDIVAPYTKDALEERRFVAKTIQVLKAHGIDVGDGKLEISWHNDINRQRFGSGSETKFSEDSKFQVYQSGLLGEDKPAKSGEELIRGSSEIPLSPNGEAQVDELGRRFAAKGGVDGVVTSSLERSKATARAIAAATGAPVLDETEALQPWHLGGLEGQPTTAALGEMKGLIVDRPDEAPAGRGPMSTADGESFNTFRKRLLGYVAGLIDNWSRDPARKVVAVTHYRGIKAIQAWLKAGMPADLSVDPKEMLRHDGEPGGVYRLAPQPGGGPWRLDEADMEAEGPLPPGLYVTRHGLTAWNAEDLKAREKAK